VLRCVLQCVEVCVASKRQDMCSYGVASVSRIDKITGLFCKRDL